MDTCRACDIVPLTHVETKRRLRQEGKVCDALVVFQHDAQVVTGRLVPGKRGLTVQVEIGEDAHFDATRDA